MDALTIVSQSLPPLMATLPYSFQLQALGGILPYSWQIVPGFGTPPSGMNLVGDTLVAAVGAVTENQVGSHSFRIRVTDGAATTVVADVSVDVRPYGFTRAHDFLLDPQVFSLIQAYLSGEQTPEKVQKHFFRDISSPIGTYFLHVARDILVEDWAGLYPFHAVADEGLRDVLDSIANDLLYFANPLKFRITSVTPGPGALQVTYTLTSTEGVFIGRTGETDAAMARKWFRLVDCDSEDEPEDGNGNPLTITSISDANGVEINPNVNAYQSDTDGFHTGKDAVGASIGFNLTFVVEYSPNPDSKIPVPPWCMRYGEREELHNISPEAFIKFGNVIGEVDADVIALIKSAPFTAGLRIGSQVVKPNSDQEIILQGQNGLDIEADIINSKVRLVGPDSVRTINQVPPAGAGDFEIKDGEFIEVVSEVQDGNLTIRTVIPIQAQDAVVDKGLVSDLDYGRFLQLIGRNLVKMHLHEGEDLRMGTPGDGVWSDGWIPVDKDMSLADCFDRLNEALAVSLPPVIVGLDETVGWVDNQGPPPSIKRDHSYLAFDPGIIYPPAYPAGDEYPLCFNVNAYPPPAVVTTSTEFYVVGGETVDMLVNGVSYTGGVGFPIPPLPAPTPVVIAPQIQISSIRLAAGGFYVKVDLLLDMVTPDPALLPFLVRGYNTFQLSVLPPQPGYSGLSALMEVFTDNTMPSVGGIALPTTVYGDAPGKTVILSGVEHYSGDNELLVSFTANNTFQDVYYQKPYEIQLKDPVSNQWQDPVSVDISDMGGVSSPPASLDNPSLAGFGTGRPVKDYAVEQSAPNAYLRLSHFRSHGFFSLDQTSNLTTTVGELLLYTLETADTTDKAEYFEDERYRLNKDDPKWASYQYVPVMVRETFHWHSDLPLYPGVAPWGDGGGDAGQLQVNPRIIHGAGVTAPNEGALVWPSLNYNTGSYKPVQAAGRDYGNDFAPTQVAIYDRAFVFKDEPRSHGKFRITGITSADIGQSYLGSGGLPTGNVNLEIKFPGNKSNYFSGWLDLSKLSLGGGNIYDGDGCRVGAIVDTVLPSGEVAVEIDWTGNGLSTTDSGEMIILRVTYRSTAPVIYAIEEIG